MTEKSESAEQSPRDSRRSEPGAVESSAETAEPDRNPEDVTAAARSGDEAQDGIVPEPMSTPVLSGQIEREHAAFVVLGALATVAVFLQLSGVWL